MKNEKNNIQPHIVHSHDVHLDTDYTQWLVELKARYRSAQLKAAVKVNAEKLLFNWQLGRDLVQKKVEERWGSGVVEQVSLDLRNEFPGEKGFSTTNLWDMKKWYLFYTGESDLPKLHQLGGELQKIETQSSGKLHQLGGDIMEQDVVDLISVPMPPAFAYVPWRHHVEILHKCQSVEEALFYIRGTIHNGWSRQALLNVLHSELFKTKGCALTNFSETLDASDLTLAQDMVKENYDFSFISLHETEFTERELEDALEQNITRFLLELGNGFAFIGRQKEVLISGKDRKVDLLFYHIRLRCYVVVELKVKAFEPEFAGKLNFYVNAVDHFVKLPEDNPTIGLLLCTKFDQTDAELAFQGIKAPLAVATYNGIKISDVLPSEDLLRQRVKQLEQELRLSRKLIHKITKND